MSKRFKVDSINFSVFGGGKATEDVAMVDTGYEKPDWLGGWGKPVSTKYAKCAYSHPALKIKVGEAEYEVHGGACGSPVNDKLDIYVALDDGTAHDPAAWPWNGTRQFILFPILDMSVPKSADEFKKMIAWLAEQIVAGKKVHVGCLGGHGRTGMVLAALVKTMMGEEDAITYVRTNYCKKAVETTTQIDWLKEHFGIKKVSGSKMHDRGYSSPSQGGYYSRKYNDQYMDDEDKAVEVKPLKTRGNIWGLKLF